jgi:hypothetical protein
MSKTAKLLVSALMVLSVLALPRLVLGADISINEPDYGVPTTKLGEFIRNAISVAIAIAALAAFAFLIWGGIQWITSGGDKAQYEAARNRITYALVGLAIVAAAWAVMQLVGKFFGVKVDEINVPPINPNVQ